MKKSSITSGPGDFVVIFTPFFFFNITLTKAKLATYMSKTCRGADNKYNIFNQFWYPHSELKEIIIVIGDPFL